jgi:hypothetical protein
MKLSGIKMGLAWGKICSKSPLGCMNFIPECDFRAKTPISRVKSDVFRVKIKTFRVRIRVFRAF